VNTEARSGLPPHNCQRVRQRSRYDNPNEEDKSLFASFSSEKEESSFFEKK
jgi:hypothetical protein